jgi:CubicO group peptidase (beta-lactamase class C family)
MLEISDAPDTWKEVSIRHLMTLTSGLPAMGIRTLENFCNNAKFFFSFMPKAV